MAEQVGEKNMVCGKCGTCCVAPDIRALDKPLGEKCLHLGDDMLCAAYAERPGVCRGYRPDEICARIAAPSLAERVEKYLGLFGLQAEASRAPKGTS